MLVLYFIWMKILQLRPKQKTFVPFFACVLIHVRKRKMCATERHNNKDEVMAHNSDEQMCEYVPTLSEARPENLSFGPDAKLQIPQKLTHPPLHQTDS